MLGYRHKGDNGLATKFLLSFHEKSMSFAVVQRSTLD